MSEFQQLLRRRFRKRRNTPEALPIIVWPPVRRDGKERLALVMRDMGVKEGIEIGTRTGVSAALWCESNPDLHLVCIDPYAPYEEVPNQKKHDKAHQSAKDRLASYNCELRRKTSEEAASDFDEESVDALFIDGDHSFDRVVLDLVKYVPKVRRGGLVMVHDYFHCHTGVVAAVEAYTRSHKIDPWYVTFETVPIAFWQRGAEQIA